MIILGIWDGHNSSATLVKDGKIVASVSEEKFTKRKMEVNFPINSIKYCLSVLDLKPKEITNIAISTTDWGSTLTRSFSSVKSDFWYERRRHMTDKPITWDLDLQILNQTGKIKSNKLFRKISKIALSKYLSKIGFNIKNTKLHLVDHHKAHAASTYFTSGMNKATCITMDALGDGYSSTINICEDNEIKTISRNPTKDSLGLFFQEVTSLAGMRILEDEGKIMALSDYANVEEDFKNPMDKFFTVSGLKIKSNYPLYKRYQLIKNLHWRNKPENYAFMAQSALEKFTTKLFENSIKETGIKDVVWAGGIASNIKMNMKIKNINDVNKYHVYPDMGDSGLSAGAALFISNKLFGTKTYKLKDVYLGPKFDDDEILKTLKKFKKKISYEERTDSSKYAGELISNNNIVFWFQDRIETGQRALGNRSILANATNPKIKEELNLKIKKRSWYQPFCPTILKEDANKFVHEKELDRFMTMGYYLKDESIEKAKSVMNIDKSIRPQFLNDENPKYEKLLKQIKKETGNGIVLNTSFNIHGSPIVLSPEDAIKTQLHTKNKNMFIGNYHIKIK